jgi:hypothetical protein
MPEYDAGGGHFQMAGRLIVEGAKTKLSSKVS